MLKWSTIECNVIQSVQPNSTNSEHILYLYKATYNKSIPHIKLCVTSLNLLCTTFLYPPKSVKLNKLYSNHLNTQHMNPRFIWIPDSMGVWYLNGKVTWLGIPFDYRNILDHKQAFSVWFSDQHLSTGPFDYRTQIYHLNTRLALYSDGYCTSTHAKRCCNCEFFILHE